MIRPMGEAFYRRIKKSDKNRLWQENLPACFLMDESCGRGTAGFRTVCSCSEKTNFVKTLNTILSQRLAMISV